MIRKLRSYFYRDVNFYYGDVLVVLLMSVTAIFIALNNDYVIPMFTVEGLLFFKFPYRFRKLFLLIISIAHALRMLAQSFGYFSIKVAAFSAFENLQNVSSYQLKYIFIAGLTFVILSYVFIRLERIYLFKIKQYFLLILVSILISVPYFVERKYLTSVNLIGSDLIYAKYVLAENVSENSYKDVLNKNFKNILQIQGRNNHYLFLIESFGVFESRKANDYLLSIFKSKNIHNFKYFLTDETGAGTVGGEVRELCSKAINHSLIRNDFFKSSECAPNILKTQKYTTIAIHGGSRSIFNRPFIYKNMGFDQYFSGESLKKYSSCGGGWDGAPCDLDIIPELNDLTKNFPDPKFVYYLTINTHYPYKLTRSDDELVCVNYDIHDDATCNHFINLANTLRSIQKLSLKTNGSFYLVGDHSPPLLGRTHKNQVVSTILFNSTN